jgi:hypothetical protein
VHFWRSFRLNAAPRLHKPNAETAVRRRFSLDRFDIRLTGFWTRRAFQAVMQINNYVQALGHSFVLNKGKPTERWGRKVTGLEGLKPYGSGTARRLQ